MDDDEPSSNKSSLIKEWNLLWSSLSGEKEWPEIEEDFDSQKVLEVLSPEEIQKLSHTLSQNRKSLHQKLEQLQKNVKAYEEKLEAARLVNGETTEIEEKLNAYIDAGQALIEALQKVDDRIKVIRS